MRKIRHRLLILVPLAIVIVMFAVANREIVTVSFDPFDSAQPAFALKMPLFVLIFVLVALGVVVGGIAAWLQAAQVARARAARRGRGRAICAREIDMRSSRRPQRRRPPDARPPPFDRAAGGLMRS